MQVDAAGSFIIDKLEKELPVYLTYHNADHTQRVVKHSLEIAAALFHDSGFIETYTGHEDVSCAIARQYYDAPCKQMTTKENT